MKTRRIVFTTAAVATAAAISLLLMTALASAQIVEGTEIPHAQSDAPSLDALASSALSVTFPLEEGPWYAQREISVDPEPPVVHQATHICAEVVNHTSSPQTVLLEFSVANFGIGVPFHHVGQDVVTVPPFGAAQGCVVWMPPKRGHWCIQARLVVKDQKDQISQRNIDVWEPLVPGQPHQEVFPVGPLTDNEGHVTLAVENHLDWQIELTPREFDLMSPDETRMVTLTTIPPRDTVLGSRRPIVDVEGFLNGETIGGFRKFDWPPVPLHRPREPFFAESEISVKPYPPRVGEPTKICVELRNLTGVPRKVEVQFSWANFGIGLPFTPINGPVTAEIPAHGKRTVCTTWRPPFGGHFCVQTRLHIVNTGDPDVDYEVQFSQRNLDVAEPLKPGEPHSITFEVGNFFNEFTNPDPMTRTIFLTHAVHLPDWQVKLDPDVLPDMAPKEKRPVTLTVTPPDAPLPHDGDPIMDVIAYFEDQGLLQEIGGFRKIFRPPVPIHQPDEPPYGESEISVDPYPPRAGEPTRICAKIRNYTDVTQTVDVHFDVAGFGIGIPFTPIASPMSVELPPHAEKEVCVNYIFTYGGHFCVQVRLQMEGYREVISQRNLDVAEVLKPGQPDCFEVPVGNPFDHPVTVTLGLINHTRWDVSVDSQVIHGLPPGEQVWVSLCVTPTHDLREMEDGEPVVDLEAYVGDELIGGIRKVFHPPVQLHRPQDPVYAEREITVHPYPPRAREPTELGVLLYNPTSYSHTVTVTFSVANFGIGLPFNPVHAPFTVTIPAHSSIRRTIMWIPPRGGHWCIQVELESPDFERSLYSQRNVDVGEPLRPGEPHSRAFLVGNPTMETVTVTLGMIPHVSGWELGLSEDVLPGMDPGEEREVMLTVVPPPRRPLPKDNTVIVDVEGYVDGELIGGIRKIHRPPVPIHRPKDPVYAESEIGVDPYPTFAGHPTKLSVELHNPTSSDRVVTATFSVAHFGIGLPFTTTHIAPNPVRIFVPAGGAARGHTMWTPPWGGKFCVRVTLEIEGHEPVWSQRNIDVGEPLKRGEPHSMTFWLGSWPHERPLTVTLGLINHRPGWDVSLSADSFFDVFYEVPVSATLTVTPPVNARLGTGRPIVDVEAYADGRLIGGFRKVDRPPIPIHKPHEKVYAETELSVDPYPPQTGQDSQVCSVVQNTSSTPATVTLTFGWADFGMGIPFTTTGMTPPTRMVALGANVTSTACVTWTPTHSGHQCLRVKLTDPAGDYESQISQRNVDVEERPPCGETRTYTFTVYNDSPFTATVEIGLITFNVPDDWKVTTVPSDTLELGPYNQGVVTVTVEIPCPSTAQALHALQEMYALQDEAGGTPTIDVEGYVDGELIGGVELQFPAEEEKEYAVYLPVVLREAP